MRTWLFLLAGLLVWTGHFFALYITASLFPGTELARWLTGLLTLLALASLAALALSRARQWKRASQAELGRWLDGLATLGIALAAVAVLYQGLPALTS